MSSRNQIDSIIDDDDEFCPLCIEEFDLSDKNFKPCPCGYQICQFCYNNIKTHSEEGRCPNCRRVYDESTIQYKVPDADEFKAELALKHRRAAAAKKKEAEKREIEASSRKNLAGVRVVQKNLVYVIGLNPTIRDETQLLQTLRGPEYFGQYGEIEKIVVSKAKPGGNPNQGIGVYVTFARKIDAATCIAAVDGSLNGDRTLRAQYGTTKYCSSFLRNEQCNNRNCTFLHETGEDSETYSRQDLSSMNTAQRHTYQNGTTVGLAAQSRPLPQLAQPASQPMRRQSSKDEPGGKLGIDGSALPSSASWANKDAPLNRARRASITASRSSPSPKPSNVSVSTKMEDTKRLEKQPITRQESPGRASPTQPQSSASQSSRCQPPISSSGSSLLDSLVKAVNSPDFKFIFSPTELSAETLKLIQNHPSFIDPYGGVKRRAMREKAEQENVKQETETQSLFQSAVAEEENRESGSLQLGGEPDDVHPSRGPGGRGRESHGAIQPPSQQGTAANSAVGSPVSLSHQFQNLGVNGRGLTSLQHQQLMLLKSTNGQQPSLIDPLQAGIGSSTFEHSSQPRQGFVQSQMPQLSGIQGHTRQSSRFSFANEPTGKNSANVRIIGQQTSLMHSTTPNPLVAPTPQLSSHFYTSSSVQGPPPGLKTAGTPPISGGGMFAQGHGFTTNTNLGLNANVGKQDSNPELMRELLRGRSGTGGASGVQGHEAAKREFIFPFLQQHQTPPPLTPTTSLLGSFYGSQAGAYSEPGPQKQKKKGKKHRHANTSSGGGGVVDLADPSILQARMPQVGANAAGQALYGSQGQVDEEFPPLGEDPKYKHASQLQTHFSRESPDLSLGSGTPTLPPGLPLPHGHPAAAFLQGPLGSPSPASVASVQIPGASVVVPHDKGPVHHRQGDVSRQQTPERRLTPDQEERSIDFGHVSLDTPEMRSPKTGHDRTGAGSSSGSMDFSTMITEVPQSAGHQSSKKPKPIKLSLPLLSGSTQDATISRDGTQSQTALLTGIYPQISSRPNTPLTGLSRGSDSSSARLPRVLRVVDTPKAETPPPASSVPSVSSVPASKARSGRASISSSRPVTPGELGSDYEPNTSASVSRANSPPSSRVGYAPIRAITKNQAKKERRLKAKQAEAKKEDVASATTIEEPVQAPIIGRKRKNKKPLVGTTEHSEMALASAPEHDKPPSHPEHSSVAKSDQKSDVIKKAKPIDKSTKDGGPAIVDRNDSSGEGANTDAWKSNNTLEQLIKDAQVMGSSIKELFLERTAPLQVILAQLHKSSSLDLDTHPLFNPSNLNQRFDMRCLSEDYDKLKQPIELTEDHRKKLLQGEAIRINHESNLQKNRCLVSPRGCVLRHLSPEEEDRYLTLENSKATVVDSIQEYPALSITDPDLTNRGGGLDALFATPERFNIRWVDERPQTGLTSGSSNTAMVAGMESSPFPNPPTQPNSLPTAEADTPRNHNWAIVNTAELIGSTSVAAATSVCSFATATAQHMLGANGVGISGEIPDIERVLGMPDEELRSFIDRSQRELETARRDFDAIDKRLATLVKRNKKLVHQALATAVDVRAGPNVMPQLRT